LEDVPMQLWGFEDINEEGSTPTWAGPEKKEIEC
jgi:hypothetical protein